MLLIIQHTCHTYVPSTIAPSSNSLDYGGMYIPLHCHQLRLKYRYSPFLGVLLFIDGLLAVKLKEACFVVSTVGLKFEEVDVVVFLINRFRDV